MEGSDQKMTKRQATTLERRNDIVMSAAACFVEKGFHQTSMRDIAKRAKTSLGNLYNHFESKTVLIAEIASLEGDGLQNIQQILATDDPTWDVFESFIVAYFGYVSQPENVVLTAEITAEAMRSRQIVDAFAANRHGLIVDLIKVLKKLDTNTSENFSKLSEVLLEITEGAATRVAFSEGKVQAEALDYLLEMTKRLVVTK